MAIVDSSEVLTPCADELMIMHGFWLRIRGRSLGGGALGQLTRALRMTLQSQNDGTS